MSLWGEGGRVSVVLSLWALKRRKKVICPFVASYVLFLVMLPTYMFMCLMKLTDMHISSNATVESWLDNNNTQLDVDFKQILWCTMQMTRGNSVLHTYLCVSYNMWTATGPFVLSLSSTISKIRGVGSEIKNEGEGRSHPRLLVSKFER